MPRYDVFSQQHGTGYLLDIQTDLLDGMENRIVVPLLPLDDAPKSAGRLNPIFEIEGEKHMMATQFLATVPVAILKISVLNLSSESDQITNALDMIFYGF